MRGLLLSLLILCPFLFTGISVSADATNSNSACEKRLLSEFDKTPDDLLDGRITSQVPMSPNTLVAAYQRGVFPWGINEFGLPYWHSPPDRGVLFLDKVHIPRKDRQFIRRALASPEYKVTMDKAFPDVIGECADQVRWRINPSTGKREPEGGKWLTPLFVENYTRLFELGLAHSFEVWHNDILVAGLYGTYINGVFSGESMFHKEDDATKLALYALITHLKEKGHVFLDAQQCKQERSPSGSVMSASLVCKWGGENISRPEFQRLLKESQDQARHW